MLPKLALCAMMKDEEANIDRCLSSVENLVDFMVIIDTGSTDRSVEIARKHGAIVYPGPFNWRKSPRFDFSLHRNAGLQYCKELGATWVIVLDMDEELKDIGITPEEFKARLLKLPPNVHALATQVHENRNGVFTLSLWGTRFFRMTSGVIYEGICHNRPKLYKGMFVGASNVVIYHYGYSDAAVMVKKRERTLALLEKRVRERPGTDYEAYYYKCMTLCGQDNVDDAIQAGEKCLEILVPLLEDDPYELSMFGVLYYAIGWAYFRKWQNGDDEAGTRAYQWWMHGWELWPDDIDLNFQLCTIGHLSNNHDIIREHGDRYLKGLEKYKLELDPALEKFETPFDMNSLALGKRHVHHATPKHEAMVREIMRKAA